MWKRRHNKQVARGRDLVEAAHAPSLLVFNFNVTVATIPKSSAVLLFLFYSSDVDHCISLEVLVVFVLLILLFSDNLVLFVVLWYP